MRISKVIFTGTIFLICICNYNLAQKDILTKLVLSDTVSYHFTNEWQYLSTDIYLFNGNNFSKLINELDFNTPKNNSFWRKRKKAEEEKLEHLFIAAKLKNVRFFADKEITYPLYNFQINKDNDNKYQTFISDNIQYIRILDNLPLYSASDYIEAEINVKAITRNDRDQVLGLVAQQLKTIAELGSPSGAIFSLIGEFGNFMEANTKKKEYRFSSTIRLFEQKNFDKRLHSIKIYLMNTSVSPYSNFPSHNLKSYLDTAYTPEINRKILKKLIPYNNYPFIVVVNYKSLYRMNAVSGDEINFATIEERKIQLANDFKKGLINKKTYLQEKEFISFLSVFANLKKYLEVYNLNYKTGNSQALARNIFSIIQYYRQLLFSYREIQLKNKKNNSFSKIFNPEYRKVIEYANMYLDEDHNLRSSKALVQTMAHSEFTKNEEKDSSRIENNLSKLHFSSFIGNDILKNTPEGQIIKYQIKNLETTLYNKYYENINKEIEGLSTNDKDRQKAQIIYSKFSKTNCQQCRDSLNNWSKKYDSRVLDFKRQKYTEQKDSLDKVAEVFLINKLTTLDNINYFIKNNENIDSTSAKYELIKIKYDQLSQELNMIKQYLTYNFNLKDLNDIAEYNKKLSTLISSCNELLDFLKKVSPELFKLRSKKILQITKEDTSITNKHIPEKHLLLQIKQDSSNHTIEHKDTTNNHSGYQ